MLRETCLFTIAIERRKYFATTKTSLGFNDLSGLFMAARLRRKGCRMPKSKGGSQSSSRRCSGPLWLEPVEGEESAQAEEIDRLLLSSLKYWEVEHDLIEERLEQLSR
jgi:hypothetical protein